MNTYLLKLDRPISDRVRHSLIRKSTGIYRAKVSQKARRRFQGVNRDNQSVRAGYMDCDRFELDML